MKKIILSISVLFSFFICFGQAVPVYGEFGFQVEDSLERYDPSELAPVTALVLAGLSFNGNHSGSFKKWIARGREERLPDFRTYVDDYLQFSPIVAAYGLDAAGIPSKTDVGNRSLVLIKGELGMFGMVQLMKRTIGQVRPDGSNRHSFPSGHTAQAFAAATFLSEEYGYRFKWMPYIAYGTAASVGTFRILNNKHYVSDVLVGAAIGILAMKASYWTHRYLFGRGRNKPSNRYSDY